MTYKFFIPGMSLAETFMLVSLLFHTFVGNLWRSHKAIFIILFFVILLLHLLYVGTTGVTENLGYFRLVKYSILVLFIAIAYDNIDRRLLLNTLVIVVLVNVFGLIVQYIMHYILGQNVSLIIPFLPLVNSDIGTESINAVLANDFRPGAFFMEPSHFCYFMFFSGLFIYNSHYINKRILLPVICISLFGTFSSFGFIAGLSILGLIMLRSSRQIKIIVFVIFMAGVGLNIESIEYLILQIPQIARIIDPQSVAVTGRFLGGASQFEQLDSSYALFGLGFGNFKLDGFVNAFMYFRLSFGEIGFTMIITILFFYSIMNYKSIPYIIILVAMCFFTSMLLTPFLLVALLPFLEVNKIEKY